jgi:hypothetical protein
MTLQDSTTLFISRKLHDYMIDYDQDYLISLFKKYKKNEEWVLGGVMFHGASLKDHDKINNIERNMLE